MSSGNTVTVSLAFGIFNHISLGIACSLGLIQSYPSLVRVVRDYKEKLYTLWINDLLVAHMKKSTQWDLVGVFALVLTFVSFFVLMFSAKLTEYNILLGLGNPLLTVVFLLFSIMSFIFAYLEGKKEESRS